MRLTLCLGLLGALAGTAASAAEFGPEVDRAINDCLDAARKTRIGQPTEWNLQWGAGGLAFIVELVSQDNRVYSLRCEGGSIVKEDHKAGNKKYDMLTTRHRVEEPAARKGAGSEYPSAEITRMQYDLNWKGNPYYIYSFNLPDGRIGTIYVNAITGKVDRSSTERK